MDKLRRLLVTLYWAVVMSHSLSEATATRATATRAPLKMPRMQCEPDSTRYECRQINYGTNFTDRPLKIRPHERWGEQLMEDLLFHYNKNVRPIVNDSEATIVKFASSLIRIIDLNERTQQLTTNLWLDITWEDPKLKWDPKKFGNIYKLNIPADFIWKPDIVLYTNAAGQFQITIEVDTLVYFDGTVVWKPPAIYHSFCEINVKLFPYDLQKCELKFGDWSYDGNYVDTEQKEKGIKEGENNEWGFPIFYQENGMDLSYFQTSAEWDLLHLSSRKHSIIYASCCGATKYADVTFYFHLRRKALFFTVFLVVPCILIACLTTFVSLLPSCSMKKMTLAISIFVSVTVFATAMVDLVPPTSLVTPLIMKYLVFTMFLIIISIAVNVMSLNLHYRTSHTHKMSSWMRWFFLRMAPKLLCMKIPEWHQVDPRVVEIKKKIRNSVAYSDRLCGSFERRPSPFFAHTFRRDKTGQLMHLANKWSMHPAVVKQMIENVNAIGELFSCMEDDDQVKEDWSYVALVLDRITLWLFTAANIIGTVFIVTEAIMALEGAQPLVIPDQKGPLGGDTYLKELLIRHNITLPSYDNNTY